MWMRAITLNKRETERGPAADRPVSPAPDANGEINANKWSWGQTGASASCELAATSLANSVLTLCAKFWLFRENTNNAHRVTPLLDHHHYDSFCLNLAFLIPCLLNLPIYSFLQILKTHKLDFASDMKANKLNTWEEIAQVKLNPIRSN